jgi:secreted PhoX family phosphatase
MHRRDFVRLGAALTAVAAHSVVTPPAWARRLHRAGPSPYGDLEPANEIGLMLPKSFRAREVARSGQSVGSTSYRWPIFPDGGATYAVPDGWIYVSNSELPTAGGVSAIRFDGRGDIADAYSICTGTSTNCAGGATPWQTWLTCEEVDDGHVWECDPTGRRPAERRPALGTFKHEAVAVDTSDGRLYLTEDVGDGRLYRFTPRRWGDLSEGLLEVAIVSNKGRVSWEEVPEPNPDVAAGALETRYQVPESTRFIGGEGIAYAQGHVYVSTKGDDTIWDYDARGKTIRARYRSSADPARQLSGVDNVAVSRAGDLIVAEDGGDMELVLLTPEGFAAPLVRAVGQLGSELAGPAFDPSGTRLYFSSQRAGQGGITYEISGPFRAYAQLRRRLARRRSA